MLSQTLQPSPYLRHDDNSQGRDLPPQKHTFSTWRNCGRLSLRCSRRVSNPRLMASTSSPAPIRHEEANGYEQRYSYDHSVCKHQNSHGLRPQFSGRSGRCQSTPVMPWLDRGKPAGDSGRCGGLFSTAIAGKARCIVGVADDYCLVCCARFEEFSRTSFFSEALNERVESLCGDSRDSRLRRW